MAIEFSSAATGWSSSWVDAPLSRGPQPSDAARFSDLLNQAPAGSGGEYVHRVAAVQSAEAIGPGSSMGDSILRAMRGAGDNYTRFSAEVDQVMAQEGQLGAVDLVRLQFRMIDTSLQVDLLSKAVSKATQHVDQLTKLQ